MSRAEVESAGRSSANGTAKAKILGEFVLLVDPFEQSIGKWLANDGFWEAWITSYFTSVLKPGDIFLDVGSNYGYYTRLAEYLTGPTGRVIAIEANPNLVSLLRESIERFPIKNGAPVDVINVAAWDSSRTLNLNIPKLVGGASLIWGQKKDKRIEVQASELDAIIKQKVDVIKIDIEGSEPFAMAGMANLIKSARLIVVEVSKDYSREFLQNIFKKYKTYYINNTGEEEVISFKDLQNHSEVIMMVLKKKSQIKIFLNLQFKRQILGKLHLFSNTLMRKC